MAIQRLHHIAVATPDVSETERFAMDFGLCFADRLDGKTYFKTCGKDRYSYVIEHGNTASLRRIAFEMDSMEDLERAVAEKGATSVASLVAPGGGHYVSLTSPDGIEICLVHGIAEGEASKTLPDLIHNHGENKLRRGQPQQSRPPAPAELFRLGHIGLFSNNVPRTRQWFVDTLELVPTDEMYIGEKSNLVCSFMRIDRGEEWVDHHAVAVFTGAKPDLHHVSFEVADYEAQFMAHRHMQVKGWELVWGVGRHPLGSHVFDMWRDPNRYRFETFSDTDLANAATPHSLHDALKQEMDRWSPPGPVDRYFA